MKGFGIDDEGEEEPPAEDTEEPEEEGEEEEEEEDEQTEKIKVCRLCCSGSGGANHLAPDSIRLFDLMFGFFWYSRAH